MKLLRRLRISVRPKRLTRYLRAFNIVAVVVVIITLANLCLGITALTHKDSVNTPATNNHKAVPRSQHTDTKVVSTKVTQEAPPPTTDTPDTAAQPTDKQPTSPGKLILSATSFTVPGGEQSPSFTVRADNGAKINMPLRTNSSPAEIMVNTPASPAKQSWDVRMGVGLGLASGTYTVKIFAQDQSERYYYGTVTVTTTYNPDFTASIEPAYYDPVTDTSHFAIHFQTTQGFYAKIDSINAVVSPGGWCEQYGVTPGPTAYVSPVMLDYTCYQVTSITGSISVTITAGGKTHSASTDFTLL